jgi:hypothetical protein
MRVVSDSEAHILPSNASLRTRIADKRSQGIAPLRNRGSLRRFSNPLSSIGGDATIARAFGGVRWHCANS